MYIGALINHLLRMAASNDCKFLNALKPIYIFPTNKLKYLPMTCSCTDIVLLFYHF